MTVLCFDRFGPASGGAGGAGDLVPDILAMDEGERLALLAKVNSGEMTINQVGVGVL